ncbi:MAG: hypothetical protein J7L39_03750 [Candidatus Aenigmarchaeota archaeon]|nr:hypothetical protein [Candidatus Aenigmarchaeota archaeon]
MNVDEEEEIITNKLRLTAKQLVIYRELRKIDVKAAKCYLSAIIVLEHEENPDRFAQSAHSLRELTSLISRRVSVPREIHCGEKGGLKRKLKKLFIGKPDLFPDSLEKEVEGLLKEWCKIHDFFTAISHHGKEVTNEEFKEKLSEFENLLLEFLKPFPEKIKELDSLLDLEIPTKEHVDKLLKVLKHSKHVEYFFSKLTSPKWLSFLKEKGFFSNPPKPFREGNYIYFPIWPQSGYLIKVAVKKPREVMDIIKDIPETGNFRVHLDLVECSFRMPSSIAKEIVPFAKKWVKTPYLTLIREKLGDLVVKLTEEGENEAAIELLDSILDVIIEEGRDEKEELMGESRSTKPYFNIWEYEQVLKRVIPILGSKMPCAITEILCKKLEKAIKLDLSLKKIETEYYDFSHIWRPAIEDHPQNEGFENVKCLLVTTLRNHLETLGKTNKGKFFECYSILSNYSFAIFRRIELHLMRLFPEFLKDKIEETLCKKTFFEDALLWHEYFHLLSVQFSSLSVDLQNTILKWIEEGPDIEEYKSWYLRERKTSPKQEELDAYKASWQLRCLYAIKNYLPPDWRNKFEKLIKKYGEQKHPDFHFYIEVKWGITTPLTKEEVEKMSPQDLMRYLKEWKPSQRMFASSRIGLGEILKEVVGEFPSRYVEISQEFTELHPVYVYYLIEGFREAIKKGKHFDWKPIILLCQKILTIFNLSSVPMDEDKIIDWKSIKKAIANLLEEGFKSKEVSCPFEFREVLWDLLKILVEDEEPTLEYEKEYGGSNMNPVTLSINTVRGQAMHALIRYALWCVQNLNLEKSKNRMVPEVKEVLKSKLNTEVEPTKTIRSVYGLYFPFLFYLDEDWTRENVSSIFPEDSRHRRLWRSAWEAYIMFNKFSNSIYRTLRSQYAVAINKLSSPKISQEAKKRLSEHLMIAYLRKIEPLNTENSLIKIFFNKATGEIRKHAISFVGRTIKHVGEKEVIDRIMRLWEWRLNEAEEHFRGGKSKEVKEFVEELKGFGWWFVNSVFDVEWTITQLLRTLRLTNGEIEWANKVIEQLQAYANEHPLQVVEVLILLVKDTKDGWTILFSKEKIKLLIESIIKASSNSKIKEKVTDLIGYLIKNGYYEFKEMLPE